MKSILKGAALLSAAALIASCDSSSGGGSNVVQPPPAPQVSATGSGTKGIMIGSTVTVTDAAGAQIAQTTTGTDGSYDVALENSTQGGAINGPLTVVITGGATICDFDNPDNSGDDCPTGNPAPADFVSFGQQYDLPATFALRSSIPAPDSGRISHVTPLTEIALLKAIELAAPDAPTAAQQTAALLAVSGLVSSITGISVSDISQVQPSNLANPGAGESPIALAIAGISASILGEGNADLNAVINGLAALITINADGQVTGTGTNLGQLVSAFARGIRVAANITGNPQLDQAAGTAEGLAAAYTALGGATVTIATSDPTAAGAATRTLVSNVAQAVSDITTATGAQGAGDDGSVGATEALVSELDVVARLSSDNATKAYNRLANAVVAAAAEIADGATVTDDDATDGYTFTLTEASGTLTVTDATSVWPLPTASETEGEDPTPAADRVEITVTSGTATGQDFDFSGVTMVTTIAGATAQTFTGAVSYSIVAATDTTAETETVSFDGNVATGATGTGSTFDVDVDITDPGTYTAVFTFDATDDSVDLTLSLSGTVGAALQSYTITSQSGVVSGTVTRNGTTDVNTILDGNGAVLTLTVTDGVVVNTDGVIGTFTEGTTTTATLGADGIVTFTDGSILLLPSIIFIPDNDNQ